MSSWRDPDAPVPVVFGPPERQVAGMLHPAVGGPNALGVVIASSIANEGIVLHRPLRLLARRLAARGMPALTYDPPSCGDSAGADDAPGRLAGWCESLHWARAELLERTGAGGFAVVGVRLGATLAAAAVDKGLKADALVLWDPLSTGDDWLREERTYHLLARQIPADRFGSPPSDGGEELAGFLLAGDTVDELRRVDLPSSDSTLPSTWQTGPPVFVIEGARKRRRRLAERLAARGAHVKSHDLPGIAEMLEEAERAEPPTQAIEAIADWLSSYGLPQPTRHETPGREPMPVLLDAGACERAFMVDGEAGRLFGITCEPAGRQSTTGEWVVLLNAGFVRHIGPNRLYVRWAREWARRGLPSLRLDGRSVGESDGSDGPHRSVTELYSTGAVDDASALVDALRDRCGAQALTLVGLCSGAYMAFHLALRASGVRRIVLLNPQILSYDKETSERGRAGYVRLSLFSLTKWRSMLARKSAWRQLGDRAALLSRAALAALRRKVRLHTAEVESRDWLVSALRTLQDRGTDVQFVMSESDPGLAYLARHLGADLLAAPPGSFELRLVRDADHTFRPLQAQTRVTSILDELIFGRSTTTETPRTPRSDAPPRGGLDRQ